MKISVRRHASLIVAALLALAAVALSGCDNEDGFEAVAGEPIEVGGLEYKVIFSRLLNIYDTEDADYLIEQDPPPAGSSYLGVWIQIANEDDEAAATVPEDIYLEDTDGEVFEPLETGSAFALELGEEIEPGGQVPALNTAAQMGPVGGSLIAFEITDEATENRPLELVIPGPEEDARVELDV